ncbi:MAG TPA: hypothetical protein VJI15_03395 [Candidatus Nanoarchaeia archaeon]|nr:hypothetical protein [Candidatus Nanoarchaeia archaeon]
MTFHVKIPFSKKWHLAIKMIPLLIGILLLKIALHTLGWEVIMLNALFTSLIAATIFLIGFLISGVIADYKESEKLPGELAASLEAMYDEAYLLHKKKNNEVTAGFMSHYKNFLSAIQDWFYRRERTRSLLEKVQAMNDHFSEFEPLMQANFLSRMKTEQNNIRKMILRIDHIRDVSFISSAYAIVEALCFFVIVGLLLMQGDPFYESLFFTLVVSFLVIYMVLLIKDLDNPFDYSTHGESGTEVSLKAIHDLTERILGKKG